MLYLKWLISTVIAAFSWSLVLYIYTFLSEDMDTLFYDDTMLLVFISALLVAIITAIPLAVLSYKKIKVNGWRSNRIFIGIVFTYLIASTYLLAVGRFYGHSSLVEESWHQHTLLEINTHVH